MRHRDERATGGGREPLAVRATFGPEDPARVGLPLGGHDEVEAPDRGRPDDAERGVGTDDAHRDPIRAEQAGANFGGGLVERAVDPDLARGAGQRIASSSGETSRWNVSSSMSGVSARAGMRPLTPSS